MRRRQFPSLGAAAALLGHAARASGFTITHSDAEWKKLLSSEAYRVLRQSGTEDAGSSSLLNEHRKGRFACAGCALPVFSSDAKYDSGTGWPSFRQPLENAVANQTDKSFGTRTEMHCQRCGGHLGHVFSDGPQPTGLRYCMNGVALRFDAAEQVAEKLPLCAGL